jgi:hypothetical protein
MNNADPFKLADLLTDNPPENPRPAAVPTIYVADISSRLERIEKILERLIPILDKVEPFLSAPPKALRRFIP